MLKGRLIPRVSTLGENIRVKMTIKLYDLEKRDEYVVGWQCRITMMYGGKIIRVSVASAEFFEQ